MFGPNIKPDKAPLVKSKRYADLAWDRNPYEVLTSALKDRRCDLTLVRGKVVHRESR
ncbi:MAG: hypothetical protein WD690_00585 [Vicinamibacterales bacterium]